MKSWMNVNIKIGLPNVVLVIFRWKMRKDLAVHLKLMWPISIHIVMAQHLKLQRSSIYLIHTLKKIKIALIWNSIYGSLISLRKFICCNEKWIVYNSVNQKTSWVMQNESTQTKKNYAFKFVGLLRNSALWTFTQIPNH